MDIGRLTFLRCWASQLFGPERPCLLGRVPRWSRVLTIPKSCKAPRMSSCSFRYRLFDSASKCCTTIIQPTSLWKENGVTLYRATSSSRIFNWERKLASASSKVFWKKINVFDPPNIVNRKSNWQSSTLPWPPALLWKACLEIWWTVTYVSKMRSRRHTRNAKRTHRSSFDQFLLCRPVLFFQIHIVFVQW